MDGIIMLPIGSLHPHPDNPRRDVGDVTDLAASITWLGWTRRDLTSITDYYRHLDTLGYPVSDAEKSALEGGFRES